MRLSQTKAYSGLSRSGLPKPHGVRLPPGSSTRTRLGLGTGSRLAIAGRTMRVIFTRGPGPAPRVPDRSRIAKCGSPHDGEPDPHRPSGVSNVATTALSGAVPGL